MSYVNTIILEDISKNEVVPRSVQFREIPSQSGNDVVSAKRFNLSTGDTTGTDISANCSISLNTMTYTDMWVAAETVALGTRLAGKFRLRLIMGDDTGTVQQVEINLIQKVVD
jgi:hypothetical protein